MYTMKTLITRRLLSLQDQRILESMASRMEEEERLTVLRDEAARVWRLEREQEMREREEKEAARKKRVAESQRMFKQQVRIYAILFTMCIYV